jgi:predicted phage tail protein
MNEEQKVEEKESEKVTEKVEEKAKERVSLINRLKGKNRREFLENISYTIIIISSVLIFIGILTGSFIQGFVLFASFGSFLVLIGIIVFIVSQFIEEGVE